MKSVNQNLSDNKRKFKPYGRFNWEETLVIVKDGKKIEITHGDAFTVKSSVAGKLQIASAKDLIGFTEFIASDRTIGKRSVESVGTNANDTVSTTPPKPKDEKRTTAPRPKIHVKDRITEMPTKEAAPELTGKKATGFEINDVF